MPGGTPKPIVDRFHAEIVAASKLESFRTKTLSFGFVPVISSPEQLATRIKSDLEKWGAVVKSSGIKID